MADPLEKKPRCEKAFSPRTVIHIEDYADEQEYYRENWMTDDQWFLAAFLSRLFGGFHHCPRIRERRYGVACSPYGDKMSTWDSNLLTKLVVMAHDNCVRASILPAGSNQTRIVLFRRSLRPEQTDEPIGRSHPIMAQHVDFLRTGVAPWRQGIAP